MRSIFRNLPEKYYKFWLDFLNLKNKTKILFVDFKKKWTDIIFFQRKYLAISIIGDAFIQVFYTLIPIFIGWIIEQKNLSYFFLFILVWIIALLIEFVSAYYAAILEVQCINSVQYGAFRFFLTVDPVYHTKRESGKLFAKIERAVRSYEELLDMILWDVVPTITGILTVLISFSVFSINLGLLSFALLFIIALINILLNLLYTISFEKNLIKADDKVKVINVESLNQVQLVRSYFASDSISESAKKANNELMYKEGSAWIAFAAINLVSRVIYLLSVGVLGAQLLGYVSLGKVSTTMAITLLITYLRGTTEVIRIGRRLRRLLRAVTRIRDLFVFIKDFGKQTFPVLSTYCGFEEEISRARSLDFIRLDIRDLYFDYSSRAKIFENHNLFLEISRIQRNKLYGIIGPSGMGKTTFISIIGGQLKPTSGQVCLNNISVYDIDDDSRKRLIAIQAQIATSLSGTLRKNLLLGLPEDKLTYTDDQITQVLKEVGIWKIFEEKDGLDTTVGEGGLTLSGGQRQRLNFASLYLRAQYYRPLLILIDEPTSSLDVVSERAITTMINKLAQHALTLVIAHRLKTLEDAIAILDFSLIDEKDIKFYSEDTLKKKSIYYKKLVEGQINIENIS